MKKAVLTFGRFNPPTIGHDLLIESMIDAGVENSCEVFVYPSHNGNNKKNPLDYNTKISILKEKYGGIIKKTSAKTLMEVLKDVNKKGYDDVIIYMGSDRAEYFKGIIEEYNGIEYNFENINIKSINRNEENNISSTKVREYAKQGNFLLFEESTIRDIPRKKKIDMYNTIRQLNNIKEDTFGPNDDFTEEEYQSFIDNLDNIADEDLDSEEDLDYSTDKGYVEEDFVTERKALTLQQRVKKSIMLKRLAPRLARIRAIKSKRMAQKGDLMKRARRAAVLSLKKRAAGEQGSHYAGLSPSQKISIDNLIANKLPAVGKLAARLLPKITKREVERLRKLKEGDNVDIEFNADFSLLLLESAALTDRFTLVHPKHKNRIVVRKSKNSDDYLLRHVSDTKITDIVKMNKEKARSHFKGLMMTGWQLHEAKSPEQKLRDFDKTRVGVGKPAIFDKKVVKYQRYKVPGEMVTHNIPVYSDGSTGAIPKGAQKVNEDDHNEMGIGTDSLVNKYKSMTPGQ